MQTSVSQGCNKNFGPMVLIVKLSIEDREGILVRSHGSDKVSSSGTVDLNGTLCPVSRNRCQGRAMLQWLSAKARSKTSTGAPFELSQAWSWARPKPLMKCRALSCRLLEDSTPAVPSLGSAQLPDALPVINQFISS